MNKLLSSPESPLFRALLEQVTQPLALSDDQGRIRFANPAFLRMVDHLACDALLESALWLDVMPTARAVLAAVQEGRSAAALLFAPRGRDRVWRLNASLLDGGAGVLWQAEVVAKDEFGSILSMLMDLVPVPAALLGGQGEVLSVNWAYQKLQEALAVEDLTAALCTSMRSNDAGFALPFADSSQRHDVVLEGRHSGVNHYLQIVVHRVVGREGDYLMFVEDRSELQQRRQAMRVHDLQNSLALAEQRARLHEALSGAQFLFSRPVNMLAALESRIGVSLAADDFVAQSLREICDLGAAALGVLQARMPQYGDERWELVNCNTVLHDVLKMRTERLLAEGVLVEWLPALRVPAVKAQSLALHLALSQLIDNAIDALGLVRSARVLRVQTRDGGDWLELEVCDNGPGMGDAVLGWTFEPFRTSHAAQGHVGLGLVLAQEVIRRHHGILEVDSEYSAGCRIVVRLPVLNGERHD